MSEESVLPGITIDASHSKDLDDAIWVEKTAQGWKCTVSIANVADAVLPGSDTDKEARERVETAYYAGGYSAPMLPRHLSEHQCSLLEGAPRSVFAIEIELDAALDPVALPKISVGKLRSRRRLSHADIPLILGNKDHNLHEQIKTCEVLARSLMERRRNAGAFVLYDLNTGWVTTEEGFLHRLKDTADTVGYILVQELMILANAEVARFCAEKEIPVPFRNHTARAHAPSRDGLMERIATALTQPLVDLDMIRKQTHLVLNKAQYGTVLEGHYGLNLPAYIHCTSPIRRYADLITQRQVIAYALKQPFPYSREEVTAVAEHINKKILEERENASEAMKEKANKKAETALRREDLARLTPQEFERVVKVVVRSGTYSTALAEGLQERMDAGKAALIDLYFCTLEAPAGDDWKPLKQAVIDHLAENSPNAVSMFGIAQSVGGWGQPEYEVSSSGPSHLMMHTATARITKGEHTQSSVAITAGTAKLARQRATVDLLARLVGVAPPAWSDAKPVAESTAPAKEVSVPDAGANPISSLGEYCQARAVSLPDYTDQRVGGPDHAPVFSVTCKLLGKVAVSTPQASKKEAKKEAAAKMLELLRGRR